MEKSLAPLLGFALFTTLAGYTSDALAYVTLKCDGKRVKWPSSPVEMRASQVGFPPGAITREALTEAVNLFYQNPSNFWYTLTYDDPLVGIDNGESEAWWTADPNLTTTAIALRRYDCASGLMYEADVVFYNGESYIFSTSNKRLLRPYAPYGGGFRPFQTTAIHELGHTVGLQHEADEYNIMGEDYTHIHANGSKATAYLGEDAADGMTAIYGLYPGSWEDVSVTHWKRIGVLEEGSRHRRTGMYDNAGNLLSSYLDADGEPRYVVNPGQAVQVEFTYENSGTNGQQLLRSVYLSTNAFISQSDTLLSESSAYYSRGDVVTTSIPVTIPSAQPLGKHYLGVYLDRNNAISEMREDNNATYIGIEVR